MDQTGIWKLFFATGLPECYLAARAQREDRGAPPARRKKDSPSAGERTVKPATGGALSQRGLL